MKPMAARMESLPANFFAILEKRIAALQASGKGVIRLDVGSPDLPPPAYLQAKLVQALASRANHGYQPAGEPPELLEAWALFYQRAFAVELDPYTEVLPLIGSKEGIFHLTQVLVEAGDIVLTPDPGYMTYTRAARFAGGEPYLVPLLAQNQYLPDLESIPSTVLKRAKILWLNYPNNPTAATANQDFFAQAVDFARQHNLLLCHDLAYGLVTFDGQSAPSILGIPGARDVAVEFNSLSKSHNMAGWRVGAMLGCSEAVRLLFKLKTNQDSGHFLPILQAAIEGMTGDLSWIAARNEAYRSRRDLVVPFLQEMGLTTSPPQATIYVWAAIPKGWTSFEFSLALLEQACVSLTPGTVFGPGGEGYIRIALTAPEERIAEALDRLKAALPVLRRQP